MSVTLKPQTFQQRAAAATGLLRAALAINDLKVLSASIAEVAAEEIQHSEAFARRVRAVSQELAELQHESRSKRQRRVDDVELTLLPGVEGIRVDPFAPLDPYLLQKLYGPSQLRKALSVYSLGKLKEAADIVAQTHQGTKPQDSRRIESVTDYIVEHVAGSEY